MAGSKLIPSMLGNMFRGNEVKVGKDGKLYADKGRDHFKSMAQYSAARESLREERLERARDLDAKLSAPKKPLGEYQPPELKEPRVDLGTSLERAKQERAADMKKSQAQDKVKYKRM